MPLRGDAARTASRQSRRPGCSDVTYWPLAIRKGVRVETHCRVREITVDENGMAVADVLSLQGDAIELGKMRSFFHPSLDPRRFSFASCREPKKLLGKAMASGKRVAPPEALSGYPT